MSAQNIPHIEKTDKAFLEVIQGTGDVLVDINDKGKDRNWGLKKKRSVKMYGIVARANEIQKTTSGNPLLSVNTLVNMRDCGSVLIFNHYKDGSKKLDHANFCRHRLCPMCNWRKSIKLFGQVSEIVSAILADKKARFVFITLTVKNCTADELPDVLDALNEGFKKLTQKNKKFSSAKKLKKYLQGYMKALEITYNAETDTFHPHIHAIFEVAPKYFSGDGYIKHDEWRTIWREAMHLDYDPQVNVKTIDKEGAPDPGAVAEVAKYPVKVESLLEIPDTETAARAVIVLQNTCYHRRFVTFGGDFREYAKMLKLDDVEKGDLVHVETDANAKESPVFQTLWKYNAKFGVYIN